MVFYFDRIGKRIGQELKSSLYIYLLIQICISCGNESGGETTSEAANSDLVEITPPPGEYNHGVTAIFKAVDPDMTMEFQKESGEWEHWTFFSDGCRHINITDLDICRNINENTTIKYRFEGTSTVYSAQYTISQQSHDAVINGNTFSEKNTMCRMNSDSLSIQIMLENESVIPSKYLYLMATVSNIEAGKEMLITGSDAGLTIKGNGDSAPYTREYYPKSSSEESCAVTITNLNVGSTTEGTIECTASTTAQTNNELGDSVTVSKSSWVCDQWKSGYY